MSPQDTKDTVARLTVYADKLKTQIAGAKNTEIREFLERDLKKTQAKIERLRL